MKAIRGMVPAALAGLVMCTGQADPHWWTTQGVINTNTAAADYAVLNIGQLKHLASTACDEMEAMLPGGAGTVVTSFVHGLANTNNYAVVNLGQLKNVAKPFYDRIHSLTNSYPYLTNSLPAGLPGPYPWTDTTADDADYAVANIGQAKFVFSFDFDSDGDRTADWWEVMHGLDPSDPGESSPDSDGDAHSDFREEQENTDPQNSDITPPTVTITSPENSLLVEIIP